jgi:hypothetical protein
MSESSEENAYKVDTAELHSSLEMLLGNILGTPHTIENLQRSPFPYRSSFALEELVVTLDNGLIVELLFKDLSRQALSEAGKRAKLIFLYEPRREIAIYRHILAAHLPDAAVCYGAVVDVDQARYWLFLEKVQGVPLYEVGLATWQAVACWLATMHTRFAQQTKLGELAAVGSLLRYSGNFYWLWPRRAQTFLHQMQPALPTKTLERFDRLVANYDQVVERLLALPVTFIHGEFYAANVLVRETTGELRICPVDWEMAGLGPGLLDLAALVAGNWTEEEKTLMALAYYRTLRSKGGWLPAIDEFLAALNCCRLHVAMQWLGWSVEWTPPRHQAQNWLDEVLQVMDRVVRNV